MHTLRKGLLAGLFAGLVLATQGFVEDGTPGRTLPGTLQWFSLSISDGTISRFAGFALLIVLGGLAGILFGALQRNAPASMRRVLLMGLGMGFAWWLLFSTILTNMAHHAGLFTLTFYGVLSTLPIDLLFGVVLGAVYYQWQDRPVRA